MNNFGDGCTFWGGGVWAPAPPDVSVHLPAQSVMQQKSTTPHVLRRFFFFVGTHPKASGRLFECRPISNNHKTDWTSGCRTQTCSPGFHYWHDGIKACLWCVSHACVPSKARWETRGTLLVHAGYVFSALPALTCTFFTLCLLFTGVIFLLFWDPQWDKIWETHIFYWYVCETGESWRIHTGKLDGIRTTSRDPHTRIMLVVCHLCILTIVEKKNVKKGAPINYVSIIYYTCTGKNPFHKGMAHRCGLLQ